MSTILATAVLVIAWLLLVAIMIGVIVEAPSRKRRPDNE